MSSQEPSEAAPPGAASRPKARSFARPAGERLAHGRDLPTIDGEHLMVIGALAEGGVGRVLHGYDTRSRRHVAIKQIGGAPSPIAEARFFREAQLPARLHHPGIIEIFGVGRWPDGDAFYVMRLVQGTSLGQALEQPLAADERQRLVTRLCGVAEALAHAHAHRVIHRDLKPDNILLSNRGQAILIDWGLAKDLAAVDPDEPEADARRPSDPRLTGDGQIMGTPAYMPPEQARGQAVDARADVYAFGAVLLHVLTGAPPYQAPTAQEVLDQVLAGPPAHLAGLTWPRAPLLPDLIRRAMAADPADRFADGAALAAALRLALGLTLP